VSEDENSEIRNTLADCSGAAVFSNKIARNPHHSSPT